MDTSFPLTPLGLVIIFTHHFWQKSGFGRDVSSKRRKGQVSSHSGRVRFFKVEEGIHILIPAVFLRDSVTCVIVTSFNTPWRRPSPAIDVATGPRISCMGPMLFWRQYFQRGRCVRSETRRDQCHMYPLITYSRKDTSSFCGVEIAMGRVFTKSCTTKHCYIAKWLYAVMQVETLNTLPGPLLLQVLVLRLGYHFSGENIKHLGIITKWTAPG